VVPGAGGDFGTVAGALGVPGVDDGDGATAFGAGAPDEPDEPWAAVGDALGTVAGELCVAPGSVVCAKLAPATNALARSDENADLNNIQLTRVSCVGCNHHRAVLIKL
jgi:hypothetical protein